MKLKRAGFFFLSLILLMSVTFVAFAKDLKVGNQAPEFTAIEDSGKQISLKDFRGKTVILYFYPKDDTPGCTIEAKSFRDQYPNFQKKNAVILGVSYDDLASHQSFKSEYNLPFHLIVDKDKIISKAYGVDGVFFADRTTFVIGPEGDIKKIYRNVNPSHHADEVLQSF